MPPTEIGCVFGIENLTSIAKDLDSLRAAGGAGRMHLQDVHGFLTEELDAAYRFLTALREEGHCDAWTTFCPRIVKAVKLLQYGDPNQCSEALSSLRKQFEDFTCWTTQGQAACKTAHCNLGDDCQGKTIKALAWAILVESALLNDHLVHDMRRVELAKHVQFLPAAVPCFFGNDPDPVARSVFNEYVRARWPIHVFAIDPENQEQNVADAYARRREMQLALALAFTGGQINANNFSRYARRLDFELDTISLNRTVVGFSHGEDTFGWRIYPRVQVPPTRGNLQTAMQLIHGGPTRDDDLRCRQLEPGSRELLAIVIMPSFVPHVRMDVRSNWFHLTNPDRKEFSTEDSVRLGQMVGYLRQCKTQCLTEAPMGRPGDARRLLTAVDQLEKRLPLQDALVQIPYENSQGGFQLFSEGSRNLGPELIGFYGEPGINTKGTTQLFLVGRHFSVNSTKVIIGGQLCDSELLSREVMKVVVPKDTNTQVIKDHLGVDSIVCDAHVATPYGVSGHLFIPAGGGAAASGPSFDPTQVDGCLVYNGCMASMITLPQIIKVKGYKPADGPPKIALSVVLGDGSEVKLSAFGELPKRNEPASEILVPFETAAGPRKDSLMLDQAINRFLNGGTPIFSHQKPLALKVSGKVTVNGIETGLGGPLVIRLVGASAGCGACPACLAGSPCVANGIARSHSSRPAVEASIPRSRASQTATQTPQPTFAQPPAPPLLDQFEPPTIIRPVGTASLDDVTALPTDPPLLPSPPRR